MQNAEHTEIKLGLNPDIPNEVYHGDSEFLSSSALKLLLKDERAFYKKYILKESWEESNRSALDTGSYIHSLILEPHTISDTYAVWDQGRRYGSKWNKFQEDNADKIIITKSDIQLGIEVSKHLQLHPELKEFMKDIEPEVTLGAYFGDKKVKVRADALKRRGSKVDIVDVKTTISPLRDRSLQKIVETYDYDLSAAMYMDAFSSVYSMGSFYLYFIRKKPVDILVYRLSDELLDNGKRKYEYALERYEHNLKTGEWADNSIRTLELDDRYMYA